MNLVRTNILDLVHEDEEFTNDIITSFSSPNNSDIENFLKNSAIDFANRKMSVTYIVTDDDDGAFVGYYTLAHKALEISKGSISKTMQKKVERYATLDENTNSYTVSSFLLAQFGKNYAVDNGLRINIVDLMEEVYCTVREIQHMIGGGLIYLDVEAQNDKVINLYKSKTNYAPFGERIAKSNGKSYTMMIKAI